MQEGEKAGKRSRTGNRKFRGIWNKRLRPHHRQTSCRRPELALASDVGKKKSLGFKLYSGFSVLTCFFQNQDLTLESSRRGHLPPPFPQFYRKWSPGRKEISFKALCRLLAWPGQNSACWCPCIPLGSMSPSSWAFQPECILGDNVKVLCRWLFKSKASVVVMEEGKGKKGICVDLWTEHTALNHPPAGSSATRERNRSEGERACQVPC